jgi:hypothetical protein
VIDNVGRLPMIVEDFVILYRGFDFEQEELPSASKYIYCTNDRDNVGYYGDFIIPRFSCIPFYQDQELEFNHNGSRLINTYQQFLYISNLENYLPDLEGLTPRTWNNLEDLSDDKSFVLKGATNSRKSEWNTKMFAQNKAEAKEIYNLLNQDELISNQKILIREYVPLRKLLDGPNGLPITAEFRAFIAFGSILSCGFYWHNYVDQVGIVSLPTNYQEFLQKAIKKIGAKSNFYTIDFAETESGELIIIELNDGGQAGLACNDPDVLYRNLLNALKNEYLSNM